MNVNLACGGVYVTDADWFNLDYASSSPAVQRANLLARLPLDDAAAELVYSSHFWSTSPANRWLLSWRSAGAFSSQVAC